MTNLEKAREFFSKDLYATEATGVEICELGDGYAKCKLDIKPHHMNAVGQVMGGVMYTLADFVFAVATNFDKDYVTVTTVSQISYFSPVKGKILYGETHMLKDGRTNCFYEINITDDLGTNIAKVTTTGNHIYR